jgi:RHS repeat-associated protein
VRCPIQCSKASLGGSYLSNVACDPALQPASLPLGNGLTTSYSYDERLRVTSIVTGSAQDLAYTYDNVGNVATMTNDGVQTTFTYDWLDRLVGASGAFSALYTYDEIGNMTRKQEGDSDYDLMYQDAGHVHAVTSVRDHATGGPIAELTYDSRGNLDTDGTNSYQYNMDNMLVSISAADGGNDSDGDGCSDSEEQGPDPTLGGQRDPENAWDFYDVPRPVGEPGTGTKDKQVDGSDALGVLAKWGALCGDPVPAAPKYDAAYDRSAPSPNAWNTQAPNCTIDGNDATWNLSSYGHTCWPAPNDGPVSYEYDENGNLETRGDDTFEYDHENRLVYSVINGVNSTSVYNGDGLRMSHTVGESTTDYVWDVASGLPVVLQDGTNSYVYGLDLISAIDSEGGRIHFLYDGLGSVTDLTDEEGDVLDAYTYDAFGAIRTPSEVSGNYWLFTGEQRDSDSDLYYLRARYYDPATGRFISQDPLPGSPWRPLSLNRYPYVMSNPTRYIDPLGLECSAAPWDWGDCVGEAADKTEDVLTKPVNDFQDSVDYLGTMTRHPGSGIQETLGLLVSRFSFGDRFEVEDAVFYQKCWGLCSVFRLVPNARNITIGHFVFSRGSPGPTTIRHELVHVRQGDRYGPTWLARYLWEMVEHGYACNRYEEEARLIAGQPSACPASPRKE